MANHLSPTDLARLLGVDRQEVLEKCQELGVPIFHGEIDKSLFLATLREREPESEALRRALQLSSSPAGASARGALAQ